MGLPRRHDGRQPLDVAGRSRKADEFTYLFQVGMLGEQCAHPLVPSVVQHSDLQRGGVVAAAVVPIARRVPNQPASQVIKVGDQNIGCPCSQSMGNSSSIKRALISSVLKKSSTDAASLRSVRIRSNATSGGRRFGQQPN